MMSRAELSNGITLEYERHGQVDAPAILIILGITDNITDWPPGLYEPLVDSGFQVIRYELRDSGLSTKFEHTGTPDLGLAMRELENGKLPNAAYTGLEVAEDASLLLDFLAIKTAIVVGYSYGAMIAQLLAITAPKKVLALICLQGSNYNPALSTRTAAVQQAMAAATQQYDNVSERIETIKNLRLATNGSIYSMDQSEALESAKTSVGRTYCPDGTARIVLSRLATAPFYKDTVNITCPTLILSGDEDPIFPVDHAEDMARRIPKAKLVVINGVGHNHPRSLQPVIAMRIIDFISNK